MKLSYFSILALTLASCAGHEGWTLEGTAPAGTTQVYLEAPTTAGTWYAVDSVAPAADGKYTITTPRAKGEILRVTAGSLVAYVPADSTETISISAEGLRSGSIEAVLFNAVDSVTAAGGTGRDMLVTLNGHLASMAAYYATQRIDDLRLLQTVANRHVEELPTNARTAVLLDRFEALRTAKPTDEKAVIVAPEIGYYDISLPGRDGKSKLLSDLVDNNHVVVLAFSDFERPENSAVNVTLSEAHHSGAAVYEVGFDRNEHLWQERTAHLPWVNVYQNETGDRTAISQYFVTALPTAFIIVNGEIRDRIDDISTLNPTLKKYL